MISDRTKQALFELLRAVLAAVVSFVVALTSTSCGTTRAVVSNHATGTSTEIKITTNNPSTISVDPNTTVDLFRK